MIFSKEKRLISKLRRWNGILLIVVLSLLYLLRTKYLDDQFSTDENTTLTIELSEKDTYIKQLESKIDSLTYKPNPIISKEKIENKINKNKKTVEKELPTSTIQDTINTIVGDTLN